AARAAELGVVPVFGMAHRTQLRHFVGLHAPSLIADRRYRGLWVGAIRGVLRTTMPPRHADKRRPTCSMPCSRPCIFSASSPGWAACSSCWPACARLLL